MRATCAAQMLPKFPVGTQNETTSSSAEVTRSQEAT